MMKRFLSGRISIWSISEAWGVVYYILFSLQITVVICLISWHEIFHNTDDTPTETLIAIGQGTAPLVITIAAETLVILLTLEGTVMLAERYLKRRYATGREEGIEEGTNRERAKARRLQKRYKARLKAWNARRLKSEAEGEPFEEPLPDFDDDDEADEEDA